jgi:hypothetical protein
MFSDAFGTVEADFAPVIAEDDKLAPQTRSKAQSINSVGIYLLTLNKNMLVRNFELVFVAELSKYESPEL